MAILVPDKISKQRKIYQKQSKVDAATSKVGRGVTKLKVGKYADRPVKHNLGGLWERYLHSVGETNQYQKELNEKVLDFLDKDDLSAKEKRALKSAKGFKKSLFKRAVKSKQPMHDITVMSMGVSEYPAEMVRQVYDKLSPDVQRLKVDRLRARRYRPFVGDVQQSVETVFDKERRDLKTVVEKQKADLELLRAQLQKIADQEQPKLEGLKKKAEEAHKNLKDAKADGIDEAQQAAIEAEARLAEAKSAMLDPEKIDELNDDLDTQLQTQLTALDRLKDGYLESVARSNLRAKYRTQWIGGKHIAMSDNQVENVIADKTTAIRMRSNARLGIYSASVMCKREGNGIDVKKSHHRVFGKDFNTADIRFIIQFSMKCGKTSITVEGFDAETRHRIYQEAFRAGLNVEMVKGDELKPKNRKLLRDYDKVRQRYKDKFLTPDQQGVINQNKRMQDPGSHPEPQPSRKDQPQLVETDAVDSANVRMVPGSAPD